MRYSTHAFQENTHLLGEFRAGAVLGEISIKLIRLSDGAQFTQGGGQLTNDDCTEVTGSSFAGFSTYKWPINNIATGSRPAPGTFTDYSYIMVDSVTGRTHKDKLLVGGYPDQIAIQRFLGAVFIDTVSGTPGTTFPTGTPEQPVSNLADALTIRSTFNLPRKLNLHGTLSGVTSDLSRFAIEGDNPESDRITFAAGANLSDASFLRINLRGVLSGAIVATECIVGGSALTVTGVRGVLLTCLLRGTIVPAAGQSLLMLQVASDELFGTVIDYSGTGALTSVAAAATFGEWLIRNMTVANQQLGWSLGSGTLRLEVSNTNGLVSLTGIGEVDDQSPGTFTSFSDAVLKPSSVEDGRDGSVGRRRVNKTVPAQWTLEVFDADDETALARTYNMRKGGSPVSDSNPVTTAVDEFDPV
jgi:hypothetical protein